LPAANDEPETTDTAGGFDDEVVMDDWPEEEEA
jgi:hypothetical protein